MVFFANFSVFTGHVSKEARNLFNVSFSALVWSNRLQRKMAGI